VNSPYAPKAIAAAIVAALATLILAFATFVANEAQILFDMHLDGAALAVYISTFLVVVLAALIKLVEHVAKVIVAKALAELVKRPVPASIGPAGGGEN
jgi:hypothetical protein